MELPGLSYSMLYTALSCAHRFKLQYVDKVKEDALQSGDMHFGTAVHTGLNAALEGENGVDVFTVYWDSEKGKARNYSRFGWEDLRPMGITFIERFEKLHLKKYKPFMMEERMYGELGGVKIEGTPDFVGEYEGEPALLDFKTSGFAYDRAKLVVNPQLYMYAHLAKQCLGYDVKKLVYVVFIKGKESANGNGGPRIQVVEKYLTPDIMTNMLSIVESHLKELSARTSWPKNPNACLVGSNRCGFYGQCWSAYE